jgi:copper chaperone
MKMSNKKETILAVDGMTCSSCIRHVTAALRELPGIAEIEVKLKDGKVRVAHDADDASTGEMIAALRGAGYESRVSVLAGSLGGK